LVQHWVIDEDFVIRLQNLFKMMNQGHYDEVSLLGCKKVKDIEWVYMQSKPKEENPIDIDDNQEIQADRRDVQWVHQVFLIMQEDMDNFLQQVTEITMKEKNEEFVVWSMGSMNFNKQIVVAIESPKNKDMETSYEVQNSKWYGAKERIKGRR
jgi:hypothetical protein